MCYLLTSCAQCTSSCDTTLPTAECVFAYVCVRAYRSLCSSVTVLLATIISHDEFFSFDCFVINSHMLASTSVQHAMPTLQQLVLQTRHQCVAVIFNRQSQNQHLTLHSVHTAMHSLDILESVAQFGQKKCWLIFTKNVM